MAQSQLCDAAGFAGRMEHVYRQLWRAWRGGDATAAAPPLDLLGAALRRHNAGRFDAAVAALRRAAALEPDDARAFRMLGAGLGGLGQFAEAARCIARGARLGRLDPQTCSNLGGAYAGLGQFENAAAAFRAALSIDPAFYPAWLNFAHLRRRLDGADAGAFNRAARLAQ